MSRYEVVKKLIELKDKIEKTDGNEFTMSGVSNKLYFARIRIETFFINGKLPEDIVYNSEGLKNYIVDGIPLKDCLNKYYKRNGRWYDKKVDGIIPCKIKVFKYVYDKKQALDILNQDIAWYQNHLNDWLNSAEQRLLVEKEKVQMYKKILKLLSK